MNTRTRTLLLASTVLVLAGEIVFGASMIGLSSPQYAGPVVARPSYAPGGHEVAFWTDWRERPEIWAVSAANGRLRPIADGLEPAWSPTGPWIAFESFQAGNWNIWLVRPDGSGLTQLTQSSTSRTRDSQPAWSPDGKQIVFVSDREASSGFWIINVDGTGLRSVINPNRPRSWGRPSFSPDGTQIVLSELNCSKAGGRGYLCAGSHLLIVNADGSGLRQLTTEGFSDANPSWGARGILFDSNRLGPGIKMIDPNGTGLQVIPNTVGGIKPTWAPDGNKFAFFQGFGIHEFNFPNMTIRPLVEIKGFLIPIDIMPGLSSKIISLKETGRIRVAILPVPARHPPLAGFDPINHLSQTFLTFGRTGDERSLDSCSVEGASVVCQFKTAQAGFQPEDTVGILRAWKVNRTPEGQEFYIPVEGRGAVQIVP